MDSLILPQVFVQCCALLISAGSRLWTCHIWFRAWLFSSKTCKCKTWCRRTVQHQETGENNIFLNGHVLHILTLSIWPIFLHHSASNLVYSSPIQCGSILNLYNRSIRPSVHPSILYPSPSITAQHMLVFMYVNLGVSHAITGIIGISMVQAQANQLILYHNSTQIAGLPNTARLGPPSGLGVKVALSPAVPKKAKCWVTSHPRAFQKNKLVCSQYCYCYW